MKNFDKELFLKFLKQARLEAYIHERNSIRYKNLPGFSGRVYDDGESRLTLLQSGLENTSYIEIGYRNKVTVWNLTHRGHFLYEDSTNKNRQIDMFRFMLVMVAFLKKSIGQPGSPHRVRGPNKFVDQTMEYECIQSSQTFPVTGVERVFYQKKLVYEARFSAGWLRNN
ncbi:MAG: DUF5680 domain-containing protein [Patescibacteria group bacterium]|nr:DUF5680 domain-containing protein [Patescibacteria group bacterium]